MCSYDACASRARSTIRFNNKLTPIVFVSASDSRISQDHVFIISGADVDTVRNALFEYNVEVDDIEGFQNYYEIDISNNDQEDLDIKILNIDFKNLESAIETLLS